MKSFELTMKVLRVKLMALNPFLVSQLQSRLSTAKIIDHAKLIQGALTSHYLVGIIVEPLELSIECACFQCHSGHKESLPSQRELSG